MKPVYEPISLDSRTAESLRRSELRIAMTGASGWVGQASLEALEGVLGARFLEKLHAFGSHEREMRLASGTPVMIRSLDQLAELPPAPTLLLHYAFLTKDRVAGLSNADYLARSAELAGHVSRAIGRIGVVKMLFPSSGAVYGQPMRADRSLKDEPDTNPYGTTKLRDERAFMAACASAGAQVFVPRVFSLSGPYINKHEAYVLATAVKCALAGQPIALHARRRVFRSYVSVRDLVRVSLAQLMAGEPGAQVCDTGGEVVEVGELAARVARMLGAPDLPIQRPALDPAAADDRYVGDDEAWVRFSARLGIRPRTLDEQIVETAAWLAS